MRDRSIGGPTHEDALVLVQLARWNAELGVTESLNFLRGGQFNDWERFRSRHGPGSEGYVHLVKILQFYETVGTLWKHGLLNEELLFDWLTVGAVWESVKSLALGDREERGVPRLWENFEALAEADSGAARNSEARGAKRAVPASAG